MVATPTLVEVLLPAGITIVTVVLTKGADTLFDRWSKRRAEKIEAEKAAVLLRREDRRRAEKERDDWREKYYEEKEDHLETLSTCQDQERRLSEALALLDRRKHDPVIDQLNHIEKKRKTDTTSEE